jgi:putative nucleotidyltransferase with HDIG domain
MTREEALAIVREYIQNEGLVRHCLSVEVAMRAYAAKYDGDVDAWGLAGLLHDFDWEIHPSADSHPHMGTPILRERGVPEPIIHCILTHADYLGYPRVTPMEKALSAVDELTGMITAAVLVRPTKSLHDIEAPAVRKKMKDKAFARQVSREEIARGAEELGVELDEHIAFVIQAMRSIAPELGLDGSLAN